MYNYVCEEDDKKHNLHLQYHPPVNLWNRSSFNVWLVSLFLIRRKMYPPMNSWTTLQSADKQLKTTFFSSSNWIIICFVSQLMFQAYSKEWLFSVRSWKIQRLENSLSWCWTSKSWCGHPNSGSSSWSYWQPRQATHPSFHWGICQ